VCPTNLRQIDPRTPPEIIYLLADGRTEGFGEAFITFDENDVLARAKGVGNNYFVKCDDLEREFAEPFVVWSYLDVIKEALERNEWKPQTEAALQTLLLLPDSAGKATNFRMLHSGASLPSDVPGLKFPSLVHKDLASHPLFQRTKWHLPLYTMPRFLGSGSLQ